MMTMLDLIKKLQSEGVNVYQRKESDTWLICERDDNVGYIQLNGGYYKVSTIHKPHASIGTGYGFNYEDTGSYSLTSIGTQAIGTQAIG